MLLNLAGIRNQVVVVLQHGHSGICLAAESVLNSNDFVLVDGVKDGLTDVLIAGDVILVQVVLHLDAAVDQFRNQAKVLVVLDDIDLVWPG